MPVIGTHRADVETGVSRPLAAGRIGVLGGYALTTWLGTFA